MHVTQFDRIYIAETFFVLENAVWIIILSQWPVSLTFLKVYSLDWFPFLDIFQSASDKISKYNYCWLDQVW